MSACDVGIGGKREREVVLVKLLLAEGRRKGRKRKVDRPCGTEQNQKPETRNRHRNNTLSVLACLSVCPSVRLSVQLNRTPELS